MEIINTAKTNRLIWILSVLIPLAVVGLLIFPPPEGVRLPFNHAVLPKLIAATNSLTALCLIAALFFIKQKKIALHKASINTAMVASLFFLLFYILHHLFSGETKFGDLDHNGVLSEVEKLQAGSIRYFYYFVLLTHILLSTAVIPFVLFAYVRGYTMQVEAHRKIVKITYPLWLYVAVSGVLCYILLSPYYPQ